MRNRKGSFEVSMLVSGIMATVVIVVTLFFVEKVIYASGDLASREVCRQSVQKHAALHIKTFNPPSSTINCPPTYLEFGKDKFLYEYRGQQSNKKLPRDEKKREEAIKKAIADEIYLCLNQFGEGKLDLFGGPKKYCAVCSVIRFEDESQEVKGFYDYLIENTVPNEALSKEGVTYLDYIQGYSKTGQINREELDRYVKPGEGDIDTSKPYAAVFVYAKSEPFVDNSVEWVKKFAGSKSGGAVIAGGAIVGAGAIISFTGIGLPAGAAMIVTGATGLAKLFLFNEFTIYAAIAETYATLEPVRDWAAFTVFGPYEENTLKDLGCEELPLSDKNK